MGVKITSANTLLDLIDPKARHSLYMAPEGQDDLPGVEQSTPLLRYSGFDSHSIKLKCEGWTVVIDHGIDDETEMRFTDCKIDKAKVKAQQGGTVELTLRIGTSDMTAEEAGLLWSKQQEMVMLSIFAPEPKVDPIDGTQGAFDADHPPGDGERDATDIFADQSEGVTD